jgi:DNA-binding phage protein
MTLKASLFCFDEASAMEDPAYIANALGTVARAKGMTEVACKPASLAKVSTKT